MSDSKNVKKAHANGKPLRRRLVVLTKRSDFLRTFRSGQKIRPCDWMIFNYSKSDSFRAGWTCPKAVGSAPMRNRLKRWSREWLRARLKIEDEMPSVDLNIGFRGGDEEFYRHLKKSEFDQAMERGWKLLVKRSSKPPAGSIKDPSENTGL